MTKQNFEDDFALISRCARAFDHEYPEDRERGDVQRALDFIKSLIESKSAALEACIGIPARYGFAEPIEGYAARPQDLPAILHEMGKKCAALRQNNPASLSSSATVEEPAEAQTASLNEQAEPQDAAERGDDMPEELWVMPSDRCGYAGSPFKIEDEDTRYIRADKAPEVVSIDNVIGKVMERDHTSILYLLRRKYKFNFFENEQEE